MTRGTPAALQILATHFRGQLRSWYPCVGLGDHDRAFEWLEKGFEERAALLVTLKVDPVFDPLRGDPRFTDLIRRMRLAD